MGDIEFTDKLGKEAIDVFNVCAQMCDQCLFSDNKIVSDNRKAEILQKCAQTDSHFTCHKATIEGKDICCRGFYNQDPAATNLMRIAGRLGVVKFVKI